jgi:hypothetical protein
VTEDRLCEDARPWVVRERRLADPVDEQWVFTELGDLDHHSRFGRFAVALDEQVTPREWREDEMTARCLGVTRRRRFDRGRVLATLALRELGDATVALSDPLDEPPGLIAPTLDLLTQR